MNVFLGNLRELAVSFDQFVNVFLATLTGRVGSSDETLSAHCWRSYRDGRIWGHLFMPPIDWMFSWQTPDPKYLDELSKPVTGHCRRAYLKEKARAYLPADYRDSN